MRRGVVLAALIVAAWLARHATWRDLLPPTLDDTTPYERYVDLLGRAGLAGSLLSESWMAVGKAAVERPTRVSLPYRGETRFEASAPSARGLRVTLNRGQRLDIFVHTTGPTPSQVFVDVFEPEEDELTHATGGLRAAKVEVDEDRDLIVRVQPELLRAGRLQLTMSAAPALRFPVADARARDLQSVFGDPRDAGRRQHEGVDIFATRGTHVLSATDGIVMRVAETGLGGRVVWVWDLDRGLRLYYAHLDEQLVTAGERVEAGDVIGTVGNSGNARTTPPHLHFGIYERGVGAIDPYWFIAPGPASTAARR